MKSNNNRNNDNMRRAAWQFQQLTLAHKMFSDRDKNLVLCGVLWPNHE